MELKSKLMGMKPLRMKKKGIKMGMKKGMPKMGNKLEMLKTMLSK